MAKKEKASDTNICVKRKENILPTLERKAHSIKTLVIEMNKHLLFRSKRERIGVSVSEVLVFLVFKRWYCQRVGNGHDQSSDRTKKGFVNASKFYTRV